MNRIQDLWQKIFPTAGHLPPGVYNYIPRGEDAFPYRLMLRIEPDGRGILILNAHTVLHLNDTAAEFAWHIIHSSGEEEMLKQITRRYDISRTRAEKDYREFAAKLDAFLESPDLDPETFLDFDRRDPYSGELSAPYRLDCALTYQTAGGETASAPVSRVARELLTEEWKTVLERAWNAGIPHIVFTGGEPTIRHDLAELIAYAGQLGQVTGLLTDGLRLSNNEYLQELLQSGLDHIMITLDPQEGNGWEAVRDVLAGDIFLTVHLTLTASNREKVSAALDRLAGMGVKSLSLSTADEALAGDLKTLFEAAAGKDMALQWDLPVPYSAFNPVSLDREEDEVRPDGAGKAWLYVEPDGDVLPAQGVPDKLGNILTDSWADIWDRSNAR